MVARLGLSSPPPPPVWVCVVMGLSKLWRWLCIVGHGGCVDFNGFAVGRDGPRYKAKGARAPLGSKKKIF